MATNPGSPFRAVRQFYKSQTFPWATRAVVLAAANRGRRAKEQYACFGAAVGAAAAAAACLVAGPKYSQCYYENGPDGQVDRLKRWSGKTWNLRSGTSPGFHERALNSFLEKHLDKFGYGLVGEDGKAASVLVPLCGKTVDLAFLCEQGYRVVGVEGVLRPILEMKLEQRMRIKNMNGRTLFSLVDGGWSEGVAFEPSDKFEGTRRNRVFKLGSQGLGYYSDAPAVWRGKVRSGVSKSLPLDILQADMFDVTSELVRAATFEQRGQFDMVYDRGGLDSIPPASRKEYVDVLSRLLRRGGRMFLIASDYDQSRVPVDPTGRKWVPPPYSLTETDIRSLFPACEWDVELLERVPETYGLTTGSPAFHDVEVWEASYLITKKNAIPTNWPTMSSTLFGSAAVLAAVALCKVGF